METEIGEDGSRLLTAEQINDLWREGLRQGNRVSFRVGSDSMAPLLRTGDRITVQPFPANERLHKGEIVLIRTSEDWVVHRIIGFFRRGEEIYYRQKGDAGHHSAAVPAAVVAARVVRIERAGRVIDLSGRGWRLKNRMIGVFFSLLDSLLRWGKRHQGEGTNSSHVVIRTWVSGLFRRFESLIAWLAARLNSSSH
ncbi:peptidase S24-like protein [bacterium BMS3Abin01]|nr:peptidase S24-like protein [bacterium BMS3Abin01]